MKSEYLFKYTIKNILLKIIINYNTNWKIIIKQLYGKSSYKKLSYYY